MNKLLFISLLFLGTLFLACTKTTYLDIPPELYQWGDFNTGSYWVYKETTTGQTDSVYVTKIHSFTDTVISDKKYTQIIQKKHIQLLNKFKNHTYLIILCANSMDIEEFNSILKFRSTYPLLTIGSNNKPKISPPYQELIDSMEINEKVYKNVIHVKAPVEFDYTDSWTTGYNEYWIVRNNWIIKKIENSKYGTKEWILLNSNIVQ